MIILGVVGALVLTGVVGLAVTGKYALVTGYFEDSDRPFPAIDTTALDERQQRIVAITRTEFEAQAGGTKYAEGVEEAWCADFVSWVMREAELPLANPNSGSWRIPGVYTLTEYYQQQNRFAASDSGYQPKLGDVVLYSDDAQYGQHTNIVLRNDGGVLTTVGGNEWGKVGISEFTLGKDPGLVGFGLL